LFETTPDAIVFANDRGQCVDANPAACRLLAAELDDILNMHVFDLFPPTDRSRISARWRTLIETGTLAVEADLIAQDGVRKPTELRAVARILPNVHVAIFRDVTDRNRRQREVEEQLRASHRQVRAVAARARARREEDRTRLARELHDQLGQSLAGLKMDVFWLRDRLGPAPSEQIAAKITSMLRLLDDTIHRVRCISSDLRPAVLDRLGLVPALEWAAEDFSHRAGIAATVATRIHEVQLDRGRSAGVLRIVQEALTNAATHSGAGHVEIAVDVAGGHIVVEVVDDGVGLPATALTNGESFGLIGMHERAVLLGGTITIRAGVERGTVVTISVPVAERRRAPRDDWV